MSTNQKAQAKVAQACMQIKGMIQRIKTRLEQYELFEEAITNKTWVSPPIFTHYQRPTREHRRPQQYYIDEDQSALFEPAITSADSYPSSSSTPQGPSSSMLPPPWEQQVKRKIILLLYPAECKPFVDYNKSKLDEEMKRFYRLSNYDFDYIPLDDTINICNMISSLPNLQGIFSLVFLYEPNVGQRSLQITEDALSCIKTRPSSKNVDFMRILLVPENIQFQLPDTIANYPYCIATYTTTNTNRKKILKIDNC